MENSEVIVKPQYDQVFIGWIYFIQLITDESLHLYKIGYTGDLDSRMVQHRSLLGREKQFRSLNYRVIISVALMGSSEQINLRKVERAFHSRFDIFRISQYRLSNQQDSRWYPNGTEWFKVPEEVVADEMFTLTHFHFAEKLDSSEKNIAMLRLKRYPNFYSNPLRW